VLFVLKKMCFVNIVFYFMFVFIIYIQYIYIIIYT